MKRFPPRSDTLASNLCETPSPRSPNSCRQACESDDARSCNALTSSALHCLYDLETGSHLVLGVRCDHLSFPPPRLSFDNMYTDTFLRTRMSDQNM